MILARGFCWVGRGYSVAVRFITIEQENVYFLSTIFEAMKKGIIRLIILLSVVTALGGWYYTEKTYDERLKRAGAASQYSQIRETRTKNIIISFSLCPIIILCGWWVVDGFFEKEKK